MKYSVDLKLGHYDITVNDGMYANADSLIAEGNTFEELLDNALIFFIDQDGGEAFCRQLEDRPYMSTAIYNLIYLEIARQYYIQMVETMTKQGWKHLG